MLAAGMGTIATIASQLGHDVRVIDNNSLYKFYSDRELMRIAKEFEPQVISFSITIVNALTTYRLLKEMRREIPQVIYLAGGMHAPSCYEEMLEHGIDIVINREGEVVIGPLIRHLERKNASDFKVGLNDIKGVSFVDGDGGIHRAAETPLSENFDDIPFVNYDLFNLKDFFKTGKEPAVILINGQRGCPFRCTFCSDQFLRSDRRMASADYLFQYIKYLYEKYGATYIWISDNNFLIPKKRAADFCRLMISSGLNKKVNLVAQSKVEYALEEEMLLLMKRAGFTKIGFGLERLDPFSQKMIQKTTSMERAHKILSLVKKNGINISLNAIFGFPFDTVELIREERRLFLELMSYAQNISLTVLTPIPNTPYYDDYPSARQWYLNPRLMHAARSYYAHALDLAMIDVLDINYFNLASDVIKEIKKVFIEFKKINHGQYVISKNFLFSLFSRFDIFLAYLSKAALKISPELEFRIFHRMKFWRYYFSTLLFGNKVALPKSGPE
jgi:radical SAM superfamily enzyme YgiQ (UPF0313 family)